MRQEIVSMCAITTKSPYFLSFITISADKKLTPNFTDCSINVLTLELSSFLVSKREYT